MRQLTLFALALTLTACGTGLNSYYTQSVQSWRGANAADLEAVWGKPFEIEATTPGNKLYVYKRQAFPMTQPNYSPQIGISNPERPATVITAMPDANSPQQRELSGYCLISFTANYSGKIISTDIQGTNCQISDSSARRLANPKGKTS